ncbi:hypothetical protein [Burkholderia cenocepacia]|uniref:hypothetical protein n=1 Tax=Burkholderia cenocepacia TaxID=95486 RepID=UPI000761760D|nr:hypothetical protein [Burkholderia cenocepacia]KWU24802.1 hypothetical protein AS149_32160 [Burkholderia cenocepacia]
MGLLSWISGIDEKRWKAKPEVHDPLPVEFTGKLARVSSFTWTEFNPGIVFMLEGSNKSYSYHGDYAVIQRLVLSQPGDTVVVRLLEDRVVGLRNLELESVALPR